MAAGVCPESPSEQLRDTGVPVVQPQGPFISAQVGRFLEVSWGSADRALLAPGIVMRPQSTGPGLAGHPGSFLSGRCLRAMKRLSHSPGSTSLSCGFWKQQLWLTLWATVGTPSPPPAPHHGVLSALAQVSQVDMRNPNGLQNRFGSEWQPAPVDSVPTAAWSNRYTGSPLCRGQTS